MRVGVMYDGFSPLPGIMDFVRRADDLGLDSVWIAEHIPFRDAFGPAMAFLGETRRIAVVPTAVSPYVRNPAMIAMSLATLAEFAPGRVRVVLGTGQPDDLRAIGVEPARPLRTMKEALSIVRKALAGDSLAHEGEVFRMEDRRLDFPPPRPLRFPCTWRPSGRTCCGWPEDTPTAPCSQAAALRLTSSGERGL